MRQAKAERHWSGKLLVAVGSGALSLGAAYFMTGTVATGAVLWGPLLILTVTVMEATRFSFAALMSTLPIEIRIQRRRVRNRPVLKLDDRLTIDTTMGDYAAMFRLRVWNLSNVWVIPEIRVIRAVSVNGQELPISVQLPLLLSWVNNKPPSLTAQHTAGDIVNVIGARQRGVMGQRFDRPALEMAGPDRTVVIGPNFDEIYLKVQAIGVGQPNLEPVERWFSVQLVDIGDGEYEPRSALKTPPGGE